MTRICISNLTIYGSDDGLSPGRRQAIIWTNVGILLIGSLGTNVSEISIEILTFSFKQIHFKVSSATWRPFCVCLSVLTSYQRIHIMLKWLTTNYIIPYFFLSDVIFVGQIHWVSMEPKAYCSRLKRILGKKMFEVHIIKSHWPCQLDTICYIRTSRETRFIIP